MRTSIRVASATMLVTGAVALSGCSLFSSPTAECGGEVETRILRELLVKLGAPGGTLVVPNAALALVADDLGPAAMATSARRVKAMAAAGAASFDVRSVITKERKSGTSAVCTAQVHFAAKPPANYPDDSDSVETWAVASKTYWSVEYTAEITDKGDEVFVTIKDGDCDGPGCERAKTMAELALALQGEMGDEFIKAAAMPVGGSVNDGRSTASLTAVCSNTEINNSEGSAPGSRETCLFGDFKSVQTCHEDDEGRCYPPSYELHKRSSAGSYVLVDNSALFDPDRTTSLLDTVNQALKADYVRMSADSEDCFEGKTFRNYTLDELGVTFGKEGVRFSVEFGLGDACIAVSGTTVEMAFEDARSFFRRQ